MANAYEPLTNLADRLLSRNESSGRVGFGSSLFARLGISDPFAGGDVADRALTQPRLDYLSSRAYFAELRGLTRRRFNLLDRIAGMRRTLSLHKRFQSAIATPAIRTAVLGFDEATLIDWSTQVEDADAVDGAFATDAGPRRQSRASIVETAASRALRSEISDASGVLAQLQGLLDAGRASTNRGLQRRVSALQQQAPIARAEGAQRLARTLRGVAAIAARTTGIGRQTETAGERPLAVAKARQSTDPAIKSKGLKRVLGESPVIMTLEEPEFSTASDAGPAPRRSSRPADLAQPERRVRTSHAGRVARVATEARSQGSVGRAGPPATIASTPSAAPKVEAPNRSVRSAGRPTQRVARAVVAAANTPLTDVRRGLQAMQAPTSLVASPTSAPALRTGVQRVAARVEAGLADAQGRTTGATRYLPVPDAPLATRQITIEHGVAQSVDVRASTEMAIARSAPAMQVPQPEETQHTSVEVGASPRPRFVSPSTSVAARPVHAVKRVVAPRSTDRMLAGLPAVAHAAQRAVSVSASSAQVGMARAPMVPAQVLRAHTDPIAVRTIDTRATSAAPTTAPTARPSIASRPSTGALQSTVAPFGSRRAAPSQRTGIARRSRALPTVRAAARTLSQERWGARGRMLAPAVSRFVDVVGYDDIQKVERRSGSIRVPDAVAEATFATSANVQDDLPAVDAVRKPRAAVSAAPLASTTRASERAVAHERVAAGRAIVAPRVIAPFHASPSRAPAPSRALQHAPTAAMLTRPKQPAESENASGQTMARLSARSETYASVAAPILEHVAAVEAPRSLTKRATQRGKQIVPAARRSLVPSVTPEAQQHEAERVVVRAERRLSTDEPSNASPFRVPSSHVSSVIDPVLVRSLFNDVPAAPVSEAVARINRRAEAPMVSTAKPAPTTISAAPSASPRARSVESPVARAERRAQATRTEVMASPVVSARTFPTNAPTVAPRQQPRLAPQAVFAERAESFIEEVQAPLVQPARVKPRFPGAGVERPRASARRAPASVRALGRSRARRDVRSMVPHPVGTPQTARATTRLLGSAAGTVAATEGVLVRAHESVDLSGTVADTQVGATTLPLLGRASERLAQGAPTRAVLHDGMTLAEAAAPEYRDSDTVIEPHRVPESVAGGRRVVGRAPTEDRSRFSPQTVDRVRTAVESVLRNASLVRAADRGEDPVVAIPGVRRAYGTPSQRGARYEARVTQDATGEVLKTVVVDTLTGEQISTRQVRTTGFAPRTDAVERAEAREQAVQVVDGLPRASMRNRAPEPVVAHRAPEPAHASLGQTFSDLTEARGTPIATRPMMRRRTWNRRQLAHEMGALAPAMAEAEYVEAPIASEDAPAWARRAVTGTSVAPTRMTQTSASGTPAAEMQAAGPAERAWEPSSLLGALSRAEAPEDLVKVIIERRTEVRTLRETLPAEAVRIVEHLANLSTDESELLTGGSRALAALPRSSFAGLSRSVRGARDFTQLSGTTDGMGANKIMKLADKLQGLIHLAENSRMSDAHRQLQMSQEAVNAGGAGALRNPGQAVEDQSMNLEALHTDVFKELKKQLEKLSSQQGEF